MLRPQAERPKLLLVDDKPANLMALEAVLGESGYELVKAHSGAEALAALAQQPDIAVVLLDVQMPGMDGFDVARRIKETPELREIPIILVTAVHTEDPFVRKGYEAGAIDYFSKPFDPEILKLKVGVYVTFRQRTLLVKERERQVQESEELLRAGHKLSAVLEALPVGVFITDVEARVCQTNEELLRILKVLKPEAAADMNSYAAFHHWWERTGPTLQAREQPLMQALTRGHASHKEIMRIECLDGTPTTVLMSASPLRSLDHHVVGAVVVMQDVSAHRQIEADIEQRIVSLVSAGVELEEVAAGGSPE